MKTIILALLILVAGAYATYAQDYRHHRGYEHHDRGYHHHDRYYRDDDRGYHHHYREERHYHEGYARPGYDRGTDVRVTVPLPPGPHDLSHPPLPPHPHLPHP